MSQDSKAQQRQQKQKPGAANRSGGSVDKKLNGPNRPST